MAEAENKMKKSCEENYDNPFRIFKTSSIGIMFFVMGLIGGITGPAFVHLEYILNTDTQTLATSFIGENIGYLVGSMISGVLFDRFNQALQYWLSCFVMAICAILLPWTKYFYIYFIVVTIMSATNGYTDSSSQSYMLSLWQGHRFKNALLHFINTTWTVGAFICPFIVIPFLSELPTAEDNQTYVSNDAVLPKNTTRSYHKIPAILDWNKAAETAKNTSNETYWISNTKGMGNHTTSTQVQSNHSASTLHYAYLTVGLATFIASILFLIAFVYNGPSLWNKVNVYGNKNEETKTESLKKVRKKHEKRRKSNILKCSRICLLIQLAMFMGTFIMCEYTFSIYIAPFVIKGLSWSVENGALITSLFRGMMVVGQIGGISLSLIISPGQLLLLNLLTGLAAYILMMFIPLYPDVPEIVWISVAVAGLSVSTMYSGTVIFGAQYLKASAVYSSILVTATGVGGMIEAALTGYLLQNSTHLWLIYLSLAATVINLVLFFTMTITGRKLQKLEKENENASNKTKQDIEINGEIESFLPE